MRNVKGRDGRRHHWCDLCDADRVPEFGIHFLHVRSKHKNALPLIITHGWSGSGFSRALIGAVKVKR